MKIKKCPKCNKYTLNETCSKCNSNSKDAHYKYIKIKDAPKSDVKFVRKN